MPGGNGATVRSIIELANRGLFSEAIRFYHPEASISLPTGEVAGTHLGREAIAEMIENAVKIYGRPRVRIVGLHESDGRVFAETRSVMTSESGEGPESHDFHVFDFEDGKVKRHQVLAGRMAPPPKPAP
jgi:SnoaL-like protein